MNPYRNTANILVKEKRIGRRQEFINKVVKNTADNITMGELFELAQHIAFNEGKRQGKYEASQALKQLIDVEDPEFEDVREL